MTIKDDRIDLALADLVSVAGPDQRVLWELATRLPSSRFRVRLWLSAGPGVDDFAAALAARGLEVERLAHGAGWNGLLGLWLKLRRSRPALLHLHGAVGPMRRVAAALVQGSAGAPVVIGQREIEREASPAARVLDRRLAADAEAFVVPSQELAARAARELGVARERLRVIGDGVDPPDADAERDAARCVRDLAGATPITPLWVCPERLDDRHQELVEAGARLRERGLPFVLAFTGDGPARARLEERVAAAGLGERVRFLRSPAPLGATLAAADLVVLRGARADALLVEALARSRPAIATAAGAAADLVEDGLTGVLVPPGDPIALAGAIETLARHPDSARRLGLAAGMRVRDERTWARVVEAHETVYDEALGLATFVPAAEPLADARR